MILREQFTRYDAEELHPECANDEYLEYETRNDEIFAYGYKEINGTKYRWLKKSELLQPPIKNV